MKTYFKYIYSKNLKYNLMLVFSAIIISMLSIRNIKFKSIEVKEIIFYAVVLIYVLINIYIINIFMNSKELKFLYLNGIKNKDMIKILKLKVEAINISLIILLVPIIIIDKGILDLVILIILSDIINNFIIIGTNLNGKKLSIYLFSIVIMTLVIYKIFSVINVSKYFIIFITLAINIILYYLIYKIGIKYVKRIKNKKQSIEKQKNLIYESKSKAFIKKDLLLIFRNKPIMVVYMLFNIINIFILIGIKNKYIIIIIAGIELIFIVALILDLYKLELGKEKFLKMLSLQRKDVFHNKVILTIILAYIPSIILLGMNVILGRITILELAICMVIYIIIDYMLAYTFGSIIAYNMPNLNTVNLLLAIVLITIPLLPIFWLILILVNLKKFKEE